MRVCVCMYAVSAFFFLYCSITNWGVLWFCFPVIHCRCSRCFSFPSKRRIRKRPRVLTLLSLPEDVLFHVLKGLPAEDILSVRAVSLQVLLLCRVQWLISAIRSQDCIQESLCPSKPEGRQKIHAVAGYLVS